MEDLARDREAQSSPQSMKALMEAVRRFMDVCEPWLNNAYALARA